MIAIPTVVGVLVKTIALLRMVRILRRVLETQGDLLSPPINTEKFASSDNNNTWILPES